MSSDNQENKYAKAFHHSQAGIPSGDPEVQFYKQHHDRSRTLSKDSSGVIAICFVAAILGILERLGRIRLTPEQTQGLVAAAALIGFLLVSSVLNRWFPNFRRTAATLFASAFLFLFALSFYHGYELVHVQKDYESWSSYFSVRAPISAYNYGHLLGLYAILCSLVALPPFLRRLSTKALVLATWIVMSLFAVLLLYNMW